MSLKSNPLVSILIVTLRGGENLKRCITSIKNNKYNAYELIIVNNGGGSRIVEEVKRIFPQAKIVNLKENTGFAKGNNTGYKYCSGKYILLLNDDVIVTPDFLKVLIEYGEQNNQVAVLQPKTIFTIGKLQVGGDFLTSTGFLYHYGYGKDPNNQIYNFSFYMYSANGNCMLVRSEIVKKVGLFDDDFYAYFEETDFCHRVWLAGYKVVYLPKSVVYHKGSETSRKLDKSIYLYHPYKNRICAHLKNFSLINLIKILPMLLILYQLAFFYFLFKLKFIEALFIQKAIWWNIVNLPSTLRKRKYIQKEIRKLDDNRFIKAISYTPRFSYFIYLISNLERYRDDDLFKEKYIGLGNTSILNRNTTVLVATFSPWIAGKRLPTNGSVEPLINFFAPKVGKMVLIDQPYPGSDFLNPRIEVYQNNKMIQLSSTSKWLYFLFYPFLKLINRSGTHIVFKLRDFFSVVDWCLRKKDSFDYYIGLESANALAGIFMRKLGFVKKVIYYVSDYSPQRYSQKWFNNLYLWLDRFCAIHADFIWDVSTAMQPARIKAGLNPSKSAPVIYVPNALKPKQIRFNSYKNIKPFSLVYMGTLGKDNGSDVAIKAMSQLLKNYPKAVLHIIGGGEKDMPRLQKLVLSLRLEKKVKFYGYILDGNKMAEIIRSCYLALAPYRAFAGSPRYYGDAGKIRAYAAAGLPIITTNVPPLGKEVWEKGAALIVNDTPSDFAKAIIKVFADKKLYLQLRKNSISFAKNNTWENTFTNAFKMMGNL